MLIGTLFICHQWGPLTDMEMPPTWGKGSHLPPQTTGFGQFEGGLQSITVPTAKPDLQDFLSLYQAHPGMSEM